MVVGFYPPARTKIPRKVTSSVKFKVPFGDVDMMGHVNNVRYLGYFENARTEHLYSLVGEWRKGNLGFILAHAEIDFKSPAAYRDELEVTIRITSVGNTSWVYEYLVLNVQDKRTHATGKTVQVFYDYEQKKSMPIPQELREKLLRDMASSKV